MRVYHHQLTLLNKAIETETMVNSIDISDLLLSLLFPILFYPSINFVADNSLIF